MNEKPDEPRVIEKPTDADGRLPEIVIELPADVRGWLVRNAGYARVQLGDTKGSLFELPGPGPMGGPMFMWKDGPRTDTLPWAEAVKRFGPPQITQ